VPGTADHFLVALLLFLLPPRAWASFRALRRAGADERARLRTRIYLSGGLTQWILCGLLILYWSRVGRTWLSLGLSPRLTPGAIGAAIGIALMVGMVAWRWPRGEREDALARARARMAFAEPMLPHTRAELRLFQGLAVTAGVCEELLFRGFLIWYFANYTGLFQAALLASVAFGIGHAYQGVRGIVTTGLVGAFMAAMYLVTGSLIMPMLLHAAMDLYAGWTGYRVFGAGAEA
jgi:CAAX protease family protein